MSVIVAAAAGAVADADAATTESPSSIGFPLLLGLDTNAHLFRLASTFSASIHWTEGSNLYRLRPVGCYVHNVQ